MYFCYFVVISPWKRVWPFIFTNLNTLNQGCFASSLFILTQWFLIRRFLNFVNVYSLFRNYLPLEKGLDSHHPSMLCAKFGWNWPSGSWEEDISISSMYFRYFVNIFPWKRAWIPITQGCFVPSLVEIGPMALEKKMKMWKVYR